MQILSHHQIAQKIKRLTIQILENNPEEPEIVLAGINNNGMAFAQQLHEEFLRLPAAPSITLTQIRLNPANPLSAPVTIGLSAEDIRDRVLIVVDDVANTGRTLFYAMKPLMDVLPKKVEFAVLVDRKHKSFPVEVSYMGLSLATTLREHISVRLRDVTEQSVYLE